MECNEEQKYEEDDDYEEEDEEDDDDEDDDDEDDNEEETTGTRTKLNGEKDKRGLSKQQKKEHKKTINEKVVKLSLNQAIELKLLIPIIDKLVLSISQLKVRSTLMLNALVIEACKTNIFPKFNNLTFWNQLLTIGTRTLKKPNLFVKNIYEKYFTTFPAPKHIEGDTQIINYARDELKTIFLNSIAFSFLDKQKYFIHDWLTKNNLETKDNVYPIQCKMNNWTCKTEPLKEAKSMITTHQKYLKKIGKEIYESVIRRKPIPSLKYLYFLLSLRENENEKCSQDNEQKVFCLVPNYTIRRHFITIDTASLIDILKHEKIIDTKCPRTNSLVWDIAFNTFKFKQNSNFSGMIETDGISCCIHYEQPKSNQQLQRMTELKKFSEFNKLMTKKKKEKKITKEELKNWEKEKLYWKNLNKRERDEEIKNIKNSCRKIGIDPGRSNIIYAVENVNGKEISYVLTRNEYYNKSGMTQRVSRVKNWEQKELKEENLDVAQHSPKTTKIEKLLNYCNAIKDNWISLWKSKTAKKRGRESFRVYRLRLKTVDNFFQSFTATNPEPPIVAYGNAKFSPSGKNEKSVPTSWMHDRCSKHFKTIATDEFRSTQYHNVCHHRLSNVNIKKEYFSKKTDQLELQTISIRGLKWCSHCQKFVNRDANAGINIRYCLITRPKIFCRKTPAENAPTSVWGIGFNQRL
jgi:hypothetical protein